MPQDTTQICPSCFKPTNPSPVCSGCNTDSSVRRPADVLPLWTRLYFDDRYLIGRVLGQGGFGVTYAAWDEVMQQVVAVKELYPRHNVAQATDNVSVEPDTENDATLFADAKTKFLEETRLLARPSLKSNPGIISVENFFEANGTAYMVMEYLEGQTLEDYVAFMGGRLPPDNADLMMAGVLDALHAVHRERMPDDSVMIHRDIKPENIYVTHGGQVKLLDFGAARFAGGVHDRSATAIGTEGYAALEQYTRKTQGPWTDVYAAGATWYRLVTGGKPEEAFLRSTEKTDPLTPPSARNFAVKPHIETAWLRALSLWPQDRWATVADLQTALAEPEVAAAPPAVEDIEPEPVVPVVPAEKVPGPAGSGRVRDDRTSDSPAAVDSVKSSDGSNKIYIWSVVGILGAILAYVLGTGAFGNTAPTATDDRTTVVAGTSVEIDVLSNDSDADGDALRVVAVQDGAHGTSRINSNGTLTYEAETDYTGNDQFTYTASDGNGGEADGTVAVTVTRANNAPTAVNDRAQVSAGESVAVTVLSNDRDADGDDLRVLSARNGTHGTVRVNSNGTITYTAESGYSGTDRFMYTVGDGNGGEAEGTVAVTVTSSTLRNSIAMDFVLIPAGSFMMGSANGSDDEKPVHRVRITQPFYMGKYEVTQAQWESVMGDNPSNFKGSNLPVEKVSYEDAQTFILRLNQREGGTRYRLPTEAEWEYACRAGTTGDYAGNLEAMGWYSENSGTETHSGGRKQPNAFGLYDMHGNVWEWCVDWYGGAYYESSPRDDPPGPPSGSSRVIRGGGWDITARSCRSADRDFISPGFRGCYLGFRLVRTAN